MACNSYYENAIKELCLAKFKEDMEALDQGHWCSWEDTVEWVAAYFTPHCHCLHLPIDLKWTSTVLDQWKPTWRTENPEAIYLEYFKPFVLLVHSCSFWNVSKTDSQYCQTNLLIFNMFQAWGAIAGSMLNQKHFNNKPPCSWQWSMNLLAFKNNTVPITTIWEKELAPCKPNWDWIWESILMMSKYPIHQDIYYKLIHKAYTTPYKLQRIKHLPTPFCSLCNFKYCGDVYALVLWLPTH